jgi:hypothetical protein
MLDVGVVIGQQLAGWAAVDVLIRQVGEVLFSNRPSALAFDVMGLGHLDICGTPHVQDAGWIAPD